MSLCSRVIVRNVYYVNSLSKQAVEQSDLIPIEDIRRLERCQYLSEECGDEYFMKYLFDNPKRGILFAARYGIRSLFDMFEKYYIVCLHIRREVRSDKLTEHFVDYAPCFYHVKCPYQPWRSTIWASVCTTYFGQYFWHHEAPRIKGLPLSTVAAI